MTRRQRNTLAMLRAVLTHLDAQPDAWNTLTPISGTVAQLRTLTDAAEAHAQEQAENQTPGHTAHKNQQRDRLEDAAYDLVLRLRPYARLTNDPALLQEVDISASDLDKLTEPALIQRSEILHTHATGRLEALAAYGVTADALTTLREAIETFRPLSAQRDTVRSEGITATVSLSEAIAQARALLPILDDLIPALVPDETFVLTYQHTRRINDR